MATNQSSFFDSLSSLVLRPAVNLLNRLSYARKFLLIGLVLLVPLAFLLRLQYRATSDSLEFSAKERLGVEYIAPVKDLVLAVNRHKVLALAVRLGDAARSADLASATADVEAELAKVDDVDRRLGAELQTSSRWRQVRPAWLKVRDDASLTPTQSVAAYRTLSGLLSDLILTDVGNNSNLILDPDLDSYWLMDALVVKLPVVSEEVSATAVQALLLAKEPSGGHGFELAGLSRSLTTAARDLVNVNMKTAFAETKNPRFGQSPTLESNLKAPARDLSQRVGEYVQSSTGMVLSGSSPTTEQTAKLVELALTTLTAVNRLDTAIGPELDWLCKKRVESYAGARRLGVQAGSLAGALLTYVFFGFYVSVRRSARTLEVATTKMIAGTEETFTVESRDELGTIAGSFNEINAALVQSRTLQRQVENDNHELQANIMDLLQVVSEASDGDLTVRAKVTTGALGNVADAFNNLMETLQSLIGEINRQLARTNSAVDEIAQASRTMASGATDQAEEVSAATALVQQISRDMQNINENARVASDAARRAQESAKEGTLGVHNVIAGMGTLRSNVQAGAKKMKNLGDRSMEITGIVEAINKISEKTNLLALNAAIEAARAREHGHGFSIVAEEVRKLAEKTAAATDEIERLVKTIHAETADTVEAIEKQTQFVEHESELVSRAGESLAHISQVSTESAGLVARISDVTVKQVEGVNLIVKAMDQISNIARSTQSGAEGNAKTVEHLALLSAQLVQSLRRFKLEDTTGRAA